MVEGDSFFVTVRMGEVEKISQSGEKRLGLRLFFGNSSASASTSDISRASIERLIDDTAQMARATAQDPNSGLPESSLLARDGARFGFARRYRALGFRGRKNPNGFGSRESPRWHSTRALPTPKAPSLATARAGSIYASSQGFSGEYSGSNFGIRSLRWRKKMAPCSATIGIRRTANLPNWSRPKVSVKKRRGARCAGSAAARSKPAKCRLCSILKWPALCCAV